MLQQTFTRVRALIEAGEQDKVHVELQQLEDLGIEIKAPDGLVDFRSLRDGEVVYLCWRFGEDSITHWHRVDAGFAGRRPIVPSDGFAPSYVN